MNHSREEWCIRLASKSRTLAIELIENSTPHWKLGKFANKGWAFHRFHHSIRTGDTHAETISKREKNKGARDSSFLNNHNHSLISSKEVEGSAWNSEILTFYAFYKNPFFTTNKAVK
jgi:hypothetical protein